MRLLVVLLLTAAVVNGLTSTTTTIHGAHGVNWSVHVGSINAVCGTYSGYTYLKNLYVHVAHWQPIISGVTPTPSPHICGIYEFGFNPPQGFTPKGFYTGSQKWACSGSTVVVSNYHNAATGAQWKVIPSYAEYHSFQDYGCHAPIDLMPALSSALPTRLRITGAPQFPKTYATIGDQTPVTYISLVAATAGLTSSPQSMNYPYSVTASRNVGQAFYITFDDWVHFIQTLPQAGLKRSVNATATKATDAAEHAARSIPEVDNQPSVGPKVGADGVAIPVLPQWEAVTYEQLQVQAIFKMYCIGNAWSFDLRFPNALDMNDVGTLMDGAAAFPGIQLPVYEALVTRICYGLPGSPAAPAPMPAQPVFGVLVAGQEMSIFTAFKHTREASMW